MVFAHKNRLKVSVWLTLHIKQVYLSSRIYFTEYHWFDHQTFFWVFRFYEARNAQTYVKHDAFCCDVFVLSLCFFVLYLYYIYICTIIVCTTVMGFQQSRHTCQVLIRTYLFEAYFLACSQLVNEEGYPVNVCSVTLGAAEVFNPFIANNSN